MNVHDLFNIGRTEPMAKMHDPQLDRDGGGIGDDGPDNAPVGIDRPDIAGAGS